MSEPHGLEVRRSGFAEGVELDALGSEGQHDGGPVGPRGAGVGGRPPVVDRDHVGEVLRPDHPADPGPRRLLDHVGQVEADRPERDRCSSGTSGRGARGAGRSSRLQATDDSSDQVRPVRRGRCGARSIDPISTEPRPTIVEKLATVSGETRASTSPRRLATFDEPGEHALPLGEGPATRSATASGRVEPRRSPRPSAPRRPPRSRASSDPSEASSDVGVVAVDASEHVVQRRVGVGAEHGDEQFGLAAVVDVDRVRCWCRPRR